MLLTDFISRCTSELESLYPSLEARNMALILCCEVLGTKIYTHVTEPPYEIDPERQQTLDAALGRLLQGEPLQHVLGYADFYGRRFKVGPAVLIPRPETELLVEKAIQAASCIATSVRVLDLCTGSGCIAWSLALELTSAEVVAADISESALRIARGQQFADCQSSPLFVKVDILDTAQEFPHGQFDILTANPPYIMEQEKSSMRVNVLDYEPELALFVSDNDPLIFYRAIACWAQKYLKETGTGIVEINETLGPQTAALFSEAGFAQVELLSDLSGKSRFVIFRKPIPASI